MDYSPLIGFYSASADPKKHNGRYNCSFNKNGHQEFQIVQVLVTRKFWSYSLKEGKLENDEFQAKGTPYVHGMQWLKL